MSTVMCMALFVFQKQKYQNLAVCFYKVINRMLIAGGRVEGGEWRVEGGSDIRNS